MRRFNCASGSFHHVYNRGARKMPIVHDDGDRWNFVRLLYYLNDQNVSKDFETELKRSKIPFPHRPSHWAERKPYLSILAFCLHDNHFHLLVKVKEENGLSKFMRGFPNAWTKRFNSKYDGSGSVFQGPYQERLVGDDADLRNLGLYILAKNVMERYPDGGLEGSKKNFDRAWQWAIKDNFSSFADYAGSRQSPIIDKDVFEYFFADKKLFKREVREYIANTEKKKNSLGELAID